MNLIDDSLLPDETVLYRTHHHWVVFVLPAIVFFIGLVFLNLEYQLTILGMLFTVIGFFMGLSAAITYFYSEFAVTNKRVITRQGLLNRHTIGIVYDKIESVDVFQNIIGRILGYGTVMIRGTGTTRDVFQYVVNPFKFRREVESVSVE